MALLTPPTWLENSTAHNAQDYRAVLGSLISPLGSGVAASGHLAVSEKSGTPNMSVDVAAGGVFVASTRSAAQGVYHAYNDAVENVAIAAADPTNPRIDRILVQIRDEAQDAALTQNDARFLVVQGTPAAVPVAPSITVDDYYELAQVEVAALATSITDADITDQRSTTGLARLYADIGITPAAGWTAYTPSNTNVTLTGATQTAYYRQIGKTVHFQYRLVFGGSTAFTGTVQIGLPVAAAREQIVTAYSFENGVRSYVGAGVIQGSNVVPVHSESGNAGNINATAPFTWGNLDKLLIGGTYEAA